MTHNTAGSAAELTKRLHMVQGQLEAITHMMANGKDCAAIMTQFKAARAGFDRVFALFLQENLHRCMETKKISTKDREELDMITNELIKH